MFPVLFKIGTFEVHSFGLVLIVAFGLAFLMGRARAERFGMTKEQVADLFFWTLIFGVLGARLGFILQELGYYLEHPDRLFSLQFQGLTSFGGLIGGAIAMVFLARKHKIPLNRALDLSGAPMLLGHAIGRIGCLLNGCCYGRRCSLPWGIPVQGQTGLFHPAQIYDTLMILGGLGLLLLVEKRGLRGGQSLSLALIVYGLSRFIYEFFRAGTPIEVKAGFATSTTIGGTPLTEGHVVALLTVVVGVVGFLMARRRTIAGAENEVPS